MANCPRCGQPAQPGDRFCLSCGAPLPEPYGSVMPQNPYAGANPNSGTGYAPYGTAPQTYAQAAAHPAPAAGVVRCSCCGSYGQAGTRCLTCGHKLKKTYGLVTGWKIALGAAGVLVFTGAVVLCLFLTGVLGEKNGTPLAAADKHSEVLSDEEMKSQGEKESLSRPVLQEEEEAGEPEQPSSQEEDQSQGSESTPSSYAGSEIVSDEEMAAAMPQLSADSVSDSGEYVLWNSSSQLLDASALHSLSSEELKLARNEIYARHGRLFSDPGLQAYFSSKSWYHGTIDPRDFDSSVFSDIEKRNIDLIVAEEDSRK